MKINREKSLEFVSVSQRGNLNLTPVGNGVSLIKNFKIKYDNAIADKGRLMAYRENRRYNRAIKEAKMSDFDESFVNLCQKGTINFFGKEYPISELFVYSGNIGEKKVNVLASYKHEDNELLYNESIEGINKDTIMILRQARCFYEMYLLCREKGLYENGKLYITKEVVDEINSFVQKYKTERHDKTPETYYIFNK